MSADNGYVIRINEEGKYVLQMYFMSAGYPPVDDSNGRAFDTLDAAVEEYERLDTEAFEYGYALTEYGLDILAPDDKISITRETAEACFRLVESFPALRDGSVYAELRAALGLEDA